MEIHLGCAGWSYPDWKNGFYPKSVPPKQWLAYYAKHFSYTEINTTFYQLPPPEMVRDWREAVPDSFRFGVKMWQKITHEAGAEDLEERIDGFFHRIKPLNEKISLILIQFPPRFGNTPKHEKELHRIIQGLPKSYRYVMELRENSWFVPKTLDYLTDYPHLNLVTSYLQGVTPYYKPNQALYYLRMLGDRVLTKFDRIQREQKDILNEVVEKIQELKKTPSLTDIFVIFNNHFRGFAPRDVIEFGARLGIQYKPLTPQRSLDRFFKSG
jgi:uncharacterized protein YecE (DUF72 family)